MCFTYFTADGPINWNKSIDKVIDPSIAPSHSSKKEIIYNLRKYIIYHLAYNNLLTCNKKKAKKLSITHATTCKVTLSK